MESPIRKIIGVFVFVLISCTGLYILFDLFGKIRLTFLEYKYILQYTLYVLFFLVFILSFFLNKSRVFFLQFFLLLHFLMIDFYSGQANTFEPAFSILILLFNLMFISSYKERGIFTASGIRRFSFIIIQFYFFYLLTIQDNLYNEVMEAFAQVNQGFLAFSALFFLLSLVNIGKSLNSNEDYAFFFVLINIFVLFFYMKSDYALLILIFTFFSVLFFIFAILKDFYAIAYLDELTGLPGRRALREEFLKLGDNYSIAMLDIDFFKKFNDKYGHDVGDQVLKMVASMMEKTEGGAKVYRYGGEEFTILFPGKNAREAYPFLEELRKKIASRPFIIRSDRNKKKKDEKNAKKREEVRITVSIGIADKSGKDESPGDVIKRADQALYRAKRKGRNCVKL